MDIRQRLHLSGMDSHAPELARKWGLGLEVTDFCYAPMLDDPATLPAVREKMAGIDHKLDLIPPSVIEPISAMKTGCLGHRNPRLHSDEVLIALAISGLTNPLAAMVQAQLKNLRGCEAHFSVIISEEDAKLYKRLGINVSCEAKYEVKSLYHK